MAIGETNARKMDDYLRAVREVAKLFQTDTVYVVGSQAILAHWPDAPKRLRLSHEIDAYPANAREWERLNPGAEASEEINALFGQGSLFEQRFGFYIDGVDDTTARFPPDWLGRAKTMKIDCEGRTITAISPSLEDTVVAKLARLDPRDREFIAEVHAARPLTIKRLLSLFTSTAPHPMLLQQAERFLAGLKG